MPLKGPIMRSTAIWVALCTVVVLAYLGAFAGVVYVGESGPGYDIDAVEWQIGVPNTWLRYIRLTKTVGAVPPPKYLAEPELLTRRFVFRPAGLVPSLALAFSVGCLLYGVLLVTGWWTRCPPRAMIPRLLVSAGGGALCGMAANLLDPTRIGYCEPLGWILILLLLVGLPLVTSVAAWNRLSVQMVLVLSAWAWLWLVWGRRVTDFFLESPLFCYRFYVNQDLWFPMVGYLITTGSLLVVIVAARVARKVLLGAS